MTALFIALIIIGVVDVAVMLTIDTFIRLSGRKDPGAWHLVRAAGFVAAGIGGLAMVWGGIGEFGFSIVTVVMLGAAAALIYKVIVPYTRRRWPSPPSDPADQQRVRPG
ncbi:hypothetical protein SAMN04489835_5815 [Mycolicibacterium rutilum]|uniref:Uncharacterized protein n=1 Tax=Mycolicibacterium rutilum TaxID=370526 RepID=A0A1H6M1Z2_MYCRU|nr:hypothetical protein [Mycolicibacterium rutilum]SEH92877.1 hypothetical protein SAMN04489835_5815 [Mycolicibacterium rutilum]